jgi:Fibronectin type III domain
VGGCALKRVSFAGVLGLAACALIGCHEDPAQVSTTPSGTAGLPTGTGTATLSWEAPTTTTAGAPLVNLAGYRIYYGTDENNLQATIELNGTGLQTYVLDDLGAGTWYFAVRAVTSTGAESSLSQIVSKTIG